MGIKTPSCGFRNSYVLHICNYSHVCLYGLLNLWAQPKAVQTDWTSHKWDSCSHASPWDYWILYDALICHITTVSTLRSMKQMRRNFVRRLKDWRPSLINESDDFKSYPHLLPNIIVSFSFFFLSSINIFGFILLLGIGILFIAKMQSYKCNNHNAGSGTLSAKICSWC